MDPFDEFHALDVVSQRRTFRHFLDLLEEKDREIEMLEEGTLSLQQELCKVHHVFAQNELLFQEAQELQTINETLEEKIEKMRHKEGEGFFFEPHTPELLQLEQSQKALEECQSLVDEKSEALIRTLEELEYLKMHVADLEGKLVIQAKALDSQEQNYEKKLSETQHQLLMMQARDETLTIPQEAHGLDLEQREQYYLQKLAACEQFVEDLRLDKGCLEEKIVEQELKFQTCQQNVERQCIAQGQEWHAKILQEREEKAFWKQQAEYLSLQSSQHLSETCPRCEQVLDSLQKLQQPLERLLSLTHDP